MTLEIAIGSRVRLSALGAERCPSFAGRLGWVVGGSVYSTSVSVRFDGNKSPVTLHHSYLEVMPQQDREADSIGNPPDTNK